MKPVTSWTAPLGALLLALVAGACDEHAAAGDGAEDYFYTCDDAPDGVIVYATDESYRAIVDKESAGEVESKEAEAARLMSPASGATLSAGTPPTFVIATPMALLSPSAPAGPPPRTGQEKSLAPGSRLARTHRYRPRALSRRDRRQLLASLDPGWRPETGLLGPGLGNLVHPACRERGAAR